MLNCAMPAEWIVLDVETTNADPATLEGHMRRRWSPNPSWLPETIGRRYLEAHAKLKERLALLPQSPLTVVGMQTSASELVCFHCLPKCIIQQTNAARVVGAKDDQGLLLAIRDFLATHCGEETTLVGHNLRFDLAVLRRRFLAYKLRLPSALASPSQRTYCTMHGYCKTCSTENGLMISLNDALQEIGLDSHKALVAGSDVVELAEKGKHAELVMYNILDVLATTELFRAMTGQSGT